GSANRRTRTVRSEWRARNGRDVAYGRRMGRTSGARVGEVFGDGAVNAMRNWAADVPSQCRALRRLFAASVDWSRKRGPLQGYSPVTDRQLTFYAGCCPGLWRILGPRPGCPCVTL